MIHVLLLLLFVGLGFLAVSIVGIIVFFALTGSCDTKDIGFRVNEGFECILLGIMIGVTCLVRIDIVQVFSKQRWKF